MQQLILRDLENYELLDSGEGYKLERFGPFILSRPDPNAIWKKRLPETHWRRADATFKVTGKPHWDHAGVREPWVFGFENISLLLKLTPFKHTGLFPEQVEHWKWVGERIASKSQCSILNLFAYTGGATLHAASLGAAVTHIDASKPAMIWAHENQEASKLTKAPIRWITEDALSFVKREVRRGNTYDGVLLDPPSFGRSPKGKIFKFEKDMHELLQEVGKLVPRKGGFMLLNSYATGFSPETIRNLVADHIPLSLQSESSYGELCIGERSAGRLLPCSQFVRVIT